MEFTGIRLSPAMVNFSDNSSFSKTKSMTLKCDSSTVSSSWSSLIVRCSKTPFSDKEENTKPFKEKEDENVAEKVVSDENVEAFAKDFVEKISKKDNANKDVEAYLLGLIKLFCESENKTAVMIEMKKAIERNPDISLNGSLIGNVHLNIQLPSAPVTQTDPVSFVESSKKQFVDKGLAAFWGAFLSLIGVSFAPGSARVMNASRFGLVFIAGILIGKMIPKFDSMMKASLAFQHSLEESKKKENNGDVGETQGNK